MVIIIIHFFYLFEQLLFVVNNYINLYTLL